MYALYYIVAIFAVIYLIFTLDILYVACNSKFYDDMDIHLRQHS